jgi:alkylhydroperoxidase family enzyme
MGLTKPRIPPLPKHEWSEEQRALLEPYEQQGQCINIVTTLARHTALTTPFMKFAQYLYAESTLPPRARELLILRIGWLCQAEYEWATHIPRAKQAGLAEKEITRITKGPDAEGWHVDDALLLRAVDELYHDAFISDATWHILASTYSTQQLMDLVFTVGQYTLVSMALNTFGVPLDEQYTQNRLPKPTTTREKNKHG